jgi:hypothetical protein
MKGYERWKGMEAYDVWKGLEEVKGFAERKV